MSAINSYTLLDFIDEILEQDPDLILIYAGHNEYYGALGVGSVESIGNQRWLIKSYLSLQKFRSFLLLRDVIAKIKIWMTEAFYEGSGINPSATLMARIVSEQTIPFNSDIYEAGKSQFKSNLNDILQKAKQKNVPVILSELVCNIRDQLPFISDKQKNKSTANEEFRQARLLENAGKFDEAKKVYYKAKDLDALRFRAPEEFNHIIMQLAQQYEFPVVPMKEYFERYSPHGLIGNNLILEHLHPNSQGYYLMAMAFLNTIVEYRHIENKPQNTFKPDFQSFINSWGFTELDQSYADLTIKNLKGGWPFKPKELPNRVLQNFKPKNISEQMALKVLSTPGFGLEMSHLELAEYYKKRKEYYRAYKEYEALIYTIPFETEFYEKAATVLITVKDFDTAQKILEQSLLYKESFFTIKWLGQISLRSKDYDKAINFLEKAKNMKSNDLQLLFNLGRAYYYTNNYFAGDEILDLLKSLESTSVYTRNLQALKLSMN
jgi:tetratricopeptide (TPR) repeat protein